MNKVHNYINKGIWFAIITGILLHYAYDLTGQNTFVGYFSAVNESIWEHMKLSVFPIIIYGLYMFVKLKGTVNNLFFAFGIGILLSIIIVPTLFYAYIKFTTSPVFFFDISIFLLAVIIPFKVIEKIIQLPKLPLFFNIIGLIIIVFVIAAFIGYTYNPPNIRIFKEGSY